MNSNPKTTWTGVIAAIFGLLTALSLLAESMAPVREMLPSGWWTAIALVSALSAFGTKVLNAIFQADAKKIVPLLLLAPCLLLAGCSMNPTTGKYELDRRLSVRGTYVDNATGVVLGGGYSSKRGWDASTTFVKGGIDRKSGK